MLPHAATTLNLASLVEHPARMRPDQTALVCHGVRVTYRQLEAEACRVANALTGIGIAPGDHVALSCPNLPAFPIVYYGILKTGAVVVPLNVLFKPREITYHLNDSDAKALVVFQGTPELPMASMAKAAFDEAPACEHLVVITIDPSAVPLDGVPTLAALTRDECDTFPTHPARPDDTAVMLYTSGTTGKPKGAELTHFNMVANAIITYGLFLPALGADVSSPPVILITLPLFHATGQSAQMNAGLYGGATLVLLPRFEPAAVLEAMERERVTYWLGVPTMYWTLLQHVASRQIDVSGIARHLKVAASGGAPMPLEVMRRFEAVFGVRMLEGYGLSETAPVACFNHLERPSKPGTVGQPLFSVEIRCVDEHDRPVAAGARGEVVIRGHNIMKGYYKRPEATAEAMRTGWFHTGDIGSIDADGYLAIVDRKTDLILRGGMNVYPREIEEVMMTHPAVSLVAVIGVPDERLGEEVKAFVVRRPGAEVTEPELMAWCREQFAAYKYPRSIEFRNQLPTSATGKILKRELK